MTKQAVFAMDKANSSRIPDQNGWFEVRDNPLSKVGVFPYSGLPGAPDPSRVYQVLRPEEELSHPDCLASFRLLPLVDEHTMLGPEDDGLTPAEQKGVHGVIGENVEFRDGTMYGNLKIFSQALANVIASGKRELSLGYRCAYDWTPGVWNGIPYDAVQRDVRGNHLALVREGRMGPDVAVLDHAHFNITLDNKEVIAMSDKDEKGGNGEGGGELTIEQATAMLEKLGPFIEKLTAMKQGSTPAPTDGAQDPDKPAAAAVTPPTDGAQDPTVAAADAKAKEQAQAIDQANKIVAMEKTITTMGAQLATLTADGSKVVIGEVAARDALAARVKPLIGVFDHAAMTRADLVAYACDKLELKPAKGSESAVLDGYLAGRTASTPITTASDAAPSGALAAYLNGKSEEK